MASKCVGAGRRHEENVLGRHIGNAGPKACGQMFVCARQFRMAIHTAHGQRDGPEYRDDHWSEELHVAVGLQRHVRRRIKEMVNDKDDKNEENYQF